MRIGKTLRPGRPGTARWVERFGDRLVSVRYRYDGGRSIRYTTVELIVDSCPWTRGVRFAPPRDLDGLTPETVYVRVSYVETELRANVRAAGGRWDPKEQAWELRFEDVTRLGLRSRIKFLTGSNSVSKPTGKQHS